MGPTTLYTHLKIILLQYFQFSVSATISLIQTDPKCCGICLALHPQIIGAFFFKVTMPITLKTCDFLGRLGLLPIFLLEILLLLSRIHEFPLIAKFPAILELHKFSKILCKIGNVLLDYIIIQRVMNIHPFIYNLESKGFALSLIGQWQFVGLKRTNQLLDFDIIKVLALFNCCHLGMKAFQ